MTERITSSTNKKIKHVSSLQNRRRSREAEHAFVAEGVRLIEEALQVDWPIQMVLFDETLSDRGLKIIQELSQKNKIEIAEITPALMSSISDTETPQGILAVMAQEALPLPDSPGVVILVDQLRDPGNMGTLLRTAEVTGMDAVLMTPGTVDAFSPKAIRAGMGAHFHLPVRQTTWDALPGICKDRPVFLADVNTGTPIWETDFCQPCILLIGGEAFGASQEGEALATHRVTIPMPGHVESLNAAMAAGILMAEILRQRYQKK